MYIQLDGSWLIPSLCGRHLCIVHAGRASPSAKPDALGASCSAGAFGALLSWRSGAPSLVGRPPRLLFLLASLVAVACSCAFRAPAADAECAGRPSHAPHPNWPQVGSLVDSSVPTPAFPSAPAPTAPLGGVSVLG